MRVRASIPSVARELMSEDTIIKVNGAIAFERSERSDEEITNIKINGAFAFELIVDNI